MYNIYIYTLHIYSVHTCIYQHIWQMLYLFQNSILFFPRVTDPNFNDFPMMFSFQQISKTFQGIQLNFHDLATDPSKMPSYRWTCIFENLGLNKVDDIWQTTFYTNFHIFIQFWSLFRKVQLTLNHNRLGSRQATCHYLNQWWPSTLTSDGVNRPSWVCCQPTTKRWTKIFCGLHCARWWPSTIRSLNARAYVPW